MDDRGTSGCHSLEVAVVSDAGKVRILNEDSVVVFPEKGLMIVSDGMGGHNAGDEASRIAVRQLTRAIETLVGTIPSEDSDTWVSTLAKAIRQANVDIWRQAAIRPGMLGMGATVVMALVLGRRAFVGHVGDSRAYLYRKGELRRLTMDHTVYGILFRSGELTRYLGMRIPPDPDISVELLETGDRLMLCTDGLTDEVRDKAIARIFGHRLGVQETCKALVDAAKNAKGRDNITVVIGEFHGDDKHMDRLEKPRSEDMTVRNVVGSS